MLFLCKYKIKRRAKLKTQKKMKKIRVLLVAVIMMTTASVFAQNSPWWFEGQLGVSYSRCYDKL